MNFLPSKIHSLQKIHAMAEIKTINQLLDQSPYLQKLSLQEALESYSHIELTEQEQQQAILDAKQRKEEQLRRDTLEQRAAENRRLLTSARWSSRQTEDFMLYRAANLFKGFQLDEHNRALFRMLCLYFSEDPQFTSIASNAEVKNPSLQKGILVAGNCGVGKTWLMRLFSKNQRQVFQVHSAKTIANSYVDAGAENTFIEPVKNAINDAQNFFHPCAGLCIDDLGTEDVKVHFGNKKNVLGDLIELRYSKGYTGALLHGTTNLTVDQLNQFYGTRVVSRMREIFNFVVLYGADRRV